MYRAKDGGGDRVCVHDATDDHDEVSSWTNWAETLRAAIVDQRFVVEGQPVVDLSTGRPSQVELLVRLLDRENLLIPPADFLPRSQVRAHRRHRPLGHRAGDHAAGRPSREPDADREPVGAPSINDPLLVDYVATGLASAGVAGRRLVFEIAEGEVSGDMEMAIEFSRRVSVLGARSRSTPRQRLRRLRLHQARAVRLPEDRRSFTRDLLDPNDRLIVEALVQVATGMGRRTIASFVSDADRSPRSGSSGGLRPGLSHGDAASDRRGAQCGRPAGEASVRRNARPGPSAKRLQ